MQPSRMPWPMKVEERPQMKMGTARSFATRTIALTCSVVRGRTMTAGMPPGVGPQSRVWQMRSTSLSLTYSAPQMAARRSVRLLNVPPLSTEDEWGLKHGGTKGTEKPGSWILEAVS